MTHWPYKTPETYPGLILMAKEVEELDIKRRAEEMKVVELQKVWAECGVQQSRWEWVVMNKQGKVYPCAMSNWINADIAHARAYVALEDQKLRHTEVCRERSRYPKGIMPSSYYEDMFEKMKARQVSKGIPITVVAI